MPVSGQLLSRWRALSSASVLREFADYLKQDHDYIPRSGQPSSRWFASVAGHEFELLCTGPKFLDTRASKGGGGAIDLVMHLHRVDFKRAVSLLQERGL
jgi:hypothetical protein